MNRPVSVCVRRIPPRADERLGCRHLAVIANKDRGGGIVLLRMDVSSQVGPTGRLMCGGREQPDYRSCVMRERS